MTGNDITLVRAFVEQRSERAFTALVERHLGLVYSTALRRMGDAHSAQEIAQTVFIQLARKAASLGAGTVVSAWLYRTTLYTAADALKARRRRILREQEAGMQTISTPPEPDVWAQVAPLLDEALADLGEMDRAALVLRYFENKTAQEIGAALQTGEEAAQKRVARALEKLRGIFAKRGVTFTATAIAGAVAANAVQAAPAGLAAGISRGALATKALTTTVLTMTLLQKITITAALTVAVGAGIYEGKQAADARAYSRQEQTAFNNQIQELQRERDDATNRPAASAATTGLKQANNGDETELLRLRGEVTRLRGQLQDLPANRVERLRKKVADMPEKTIPEMQFLTDKDWISVAWNADLDTDDGLRVALQQLRDKATDEFFNRMLRPALKAYVSADGNTLPTDISQLKPYLDPSVTGAMLEHYRLLRTGPVGNPSQSIVAKSGYIDPDYDSNQEMSLNGAGGGSFNNNQGAVNDAARQYVADHDGQTPTDPGQIVSYLKRNIDPVVVQKYLDQFVADPPSKDQVTLRPVIVDYENAHGGKGPARLSDLQPYVSTPAQQAVYQRMLQDPSVPK